ncbi:aminoglycoside phosphotransferase family protein [Streptomyces sp. NPDC047515]|uniref:aminoglycoside phosphotransferase family protein n=1 Tax=Streptomyces sp. NPDC047515 TaxID=3155380 RepID=UPI0033ED2CC8
MVAGKMHADEAELDVPLVRRLIGAQFSQWTDLPVEPVASSGTDNAMYRLGADMAVRLPRIPGAALQVAKEQQWLPRLAPLLPLPVPEPLGKGVPGAGYPWHWSVYPWLRGENAERVADPRRTAAELAEFITGLQSVDADGGPPPGDHNFFRGVPLADRDAATREAIAALATDTGPGAIDTEAVTAAWDTALRAPAWSRPAVWIHGDLSSGNLLFRQDRLSGVIDFGGLGVGDPACDLLPAWEIFSAEHRRAFGDALAVDAATWQRGRGWALSVALIQLPYYQHRNPPLAARSRHVIGEVLADHDSGT